MLGDGSSRFVNSVFPDGIAYQPLNWYPLGPDNIFNTDWNDISVGTAPLGMPSGDNWMVICNQITEVDAGDGKIYDIVNSVWD